jgi:hypothetical protein
MADEKSEEKDREKREEKTAEEKWRRDPLGAIVWAAILIWAGLVFLADNLGYLDTLRGLPGPGPDWFIGSGAWSLVLLGAGVIILGEVVVRLLVPAYRRPVTGSIIFAVILIGLGLGNLTNWNLVWPLVLIGLGISFLLRGFIRRGE